MTSFARSALPILAMALLATSAQAQNAPTKDACIDAYRHNQPLRRDGRLLEARSELLICARDPCPPALQKDCLEWLADLDARLPSVLLGATNAQGDDVVDVTVTMDNRDVTTRLDGRPIPVDPGPHQFRFERAGARAVVREVVVKEGEKGRRVDARLVPVLVAPAPPPPKHRPLTWPTIALGAAGSAGLVTAFVVGFVGVADRANLGSCKGTCTADQVGNVRTLFNVADVTGGASIVLLGAATVFFVLRPSVPVGTADVRLGLSPAGASITARF
jgi:hypothetical protein